MPTPPPPPVRATTIKKFLKDRTQMRVGEQAVALAVDLLTTVAEKIATGASQTALDGARNTIMARDIQEAFEAFVAESGPPLLSPATLHTAIDGIGNEALTELINLLRVDLGEASP